jgi:hypothetical protein
VVSFLDLILIHGLHSDSIRVTEHNSLASDHDGLEIHVKLEVSPSCTNTPSRINPNRLNRHLTRTVKGEEGITMKAFLDVVECLAKKCYWQGRQDRDNASSV